MASPPFPTTVEHLQRAILDTRPERRLSIGIPSRTVSMDQCYPGLYVGNSGAALDTANLTRKGITHVLNAAQGCTEDPQNVLNAAPVTRYPRVDTDAEYYQDVGINFLGFPLKDSPSANITQHLEKGANFIDEALRSGGKVLVCCFMGVSRSATMACGYLMLKQNMSAVDALTLLRRSREIEPNVGFLRQLAELDNSLRTKRGARQ